MRILARELPQSTTLLGFAGSPFTVSCYMVDGGSSREFGVTRAMALQDPELYRDLIALLTRTTTDMLIGQIKGLELFQWFIRAHLQNTAGELATGDTRAEDTAAQRAADAAGE